MLLLSPAWGQSAEEIEKLIAQLGDESASVRESATKALRKIGRPAVPALIAQLGSEYLMAYGTVDALRRIGSRLSPP